MFLKSLTLKGFKSFAETTVMDIEPGVTVVVGPNGSGKSNVVDAIAWVLGAQAPKSVRSQKMDDVIFAGTDKRQALGRAEVSLTIDNGAGLLPIEFNEVTITRVLFRTGDSEYAINGVGCRLLDIQELLSDAGVGRQQHVIVSQGQIDAVLNARPEDRRGIIEEAAGVLKYRKRKEKAERRLDATEANLLRLQDLLREVRRQLKPLERQAEAARRHGELVAELGDLKLFVAGREITALRSKLETIAADRAQASETEQAVKSALAALDTEVIGLEANLSARGAQDVTDRLRHIEQLRERGRGLSGILAERKRSLERDKGQLLDAGVVANLEADAARFRVELDDVAQQIAAAAPTADAIAAEEAAFADERATTLDALSADDSGAKAAAAAAEVRGEMKSVRQSAERNQRELQRSTARADDLVARLAQLDADVERLGDEQQRCTEAESSLSARLPAATEARDNAAAALVDAELERNQASESAAQAHARVDALQIALDEARARAGAEHLAEVDGVLGTLLDLIDIDAGWEAPTEAALGEALGAVVVADPATAQRALSALQAASLSGAVITAGLQTGASGGTRSTPAAGEAVRPRVRSQRPDIEALLDGLLASAVRVDDVTSAIDTILADPDLVVVTPDGDRFARSGWRIGAAGAGATGAALAEAHTAADAAQRRLEAADATLDAARRAAKETADEHQGIARDAERNQTALVAATERLERLSTQRDDQIAELESVRSTVSELTAQAESEQGRLGELEALLPSLVSAETAEADAARLRGEARADLEARAALLASKRRDHEVHVASLTARHQSLATRIEEAERRLEADKAERERAESRREVIERAIATIDGYVGEVVAHREVLEAEYERLSDIRRRQSDEVRAFTASLDAARKNRQDAERQLEEIRARLHRSEVDEAEAKLRLETSIDTLRRDLDVEPAVAEAAEPPALPEGATAAGRVRELDRELRLLGPINPLALEEFNELQQRHEFLEAQLDDVRSTRRDLNRVIKAVDQEIQTVFASAYADVSTNFTQLFGLLFPGGQGKLTLTQPDDLLNTGIDVEAKPSGKNVKKLSLLSGGERSLTALAFLFAVFRSRPSPFYVMDEVEAALDDVNLHRFLGLVNEFRKDAQLLIVSHQKRTMEAGDSLLGVSMQPGGSSKVVTEKASVANSR